MDWWEESQVHSAESGPQVHQVQAPARQVHNSCLAGLAWCFFIANPALVIDFCQAKGFVLEKLLDCGDTLGKPIRFPADVAQ